MWRMFATPVSPLTTSAGMINITLEFSTLQCYGALSSVSLGAWPGASLLWGSSDVRWGSWGEAAGGEEYA